MKQVVQPAFDTLSEIITSDCAKATDVPATLKSIELSRNQLTRTIDGYKANLSAKYPSALTTDVVDERLKPSYIEIRSIISKGLTKLINIRGQIPPELNAAPLINIEKDLEDAAVAYQPFEQTWTDRVSSYIATSEDIFSKYCKYLEGYVRTTAVNAKVDGIMSRMTWLIGARTLVDGPQLTDKYLDILNKTKANFLKDLADIRISLCELTATEANVHSEPELIRFVIAGYQKDYKEKVHIVFNRFLQNLNIVSSIGYIWLFNVIFSM